MQRTVVEDLSEGGISFSRTNNSKLWSPFKCDLAFNISQEPTITEQVEHPSGEANRFVGRIHDELGFEALRKCGNQILNGLRHLLRPPNCSSAPAKSHPILQRLKASLSLQRSAFVSPFSRWRPPVAKAASGSGIAAESP